MSISEGGALTPKGIHGPSSDFGGQPKEVNSPLLGHWVQTKPEPRERGIRNSGITVDKTWVFAKPTSLKNRVTSGKSRRSDKKIREQFQKKLPPTPPPKPEGLKPPKPPVPNKSLKPKAAETAKKDKEIRQHVSAFGEAIRSVRIRHEAGQEPPSLLLKALEEYADHPLGKQALNYDRNLSNDYKELRSSLEERERNAKEFTLVLDAKKQDIALKSLERDIARQKTVESKGAAKEGTFVEFKLLVGSKNPVTHLEKPKYILRSSFEEIAEEVKNRKINISTLYPKIESLLTGGNRLQFFRKAVKEIFENSFNKTENYDTKISTFKNEIKKQSQTKQLNYLVDEAYANLDNQLETFNFDPWRSKPEITVETEKVTSQFNKSDVVSFLRAHLAALVSEEKSTDPTKIDGFLSAIEKISKQEGEFVENDLVEDIARDLFKERLGLLDNKLKELGQRVADIEEQLKDESLPESAKSDLKSAKESMEKEWKILENKKGNLLNLNQEAYVSTSDVLIYNPNNEELQKGLEKLERKSAVDHPGFAFKIGAENTREVLAGKLLNALRLNAYVMPKLKVKFERGKLGEEKSPEGIASKWLEGADPINYGQWLAYGNAKRQMEEANFKGEQGLLAEKQPIIDKAIKTMEDLGTPESIQSHALIDALFCSYDSHLDQYMIKEGDAICFDFARFLAPYETFNRDGQTFATLRSTFLDYPAAEAPMTENLISTIKNWDIEEIEKSYYEQGLIGSEEEFREAQQDLDEIGQAIREGLGENAKIGTVREFAKKYGIDFQETDSKKDIQSRLSKEVYSRQARIKKVTYSKIHPKAFVQLKSRMAVLKYYVSANPNPTVKGAFKKMYPDLSLFHKVLGRFVNNPGLDIGVKVIEHGMLPRSLESIIEEAEKKGLATPEEIKQMKQSLAHLKLNSPDVTSLATTMDLS